jgi:class 3 adenylate cyclase/tetratricopeptide (TPR) repeat protein
MLFADVVGSTELAAGHDVEVVQAIMRRYLDSMQQVVVAHGGVLEKFIGDAVIAVFGAPTAHGDDPVRALRAALAMQKTARDLADELPVPIRVRFGIESGEAVVESVPDGVVVTGDVANTAARLQQAADPGQILVGASTRSAGGGRFRYEALGSVTLKGKGSVALYALVGEVGQQAEAVARAPFLGRQAELLRLLTEYRRKPASSDSRVVAITGEPGIGKSRLTHEFLATLGLDGGIFCVGHCLAYGRDIAYWPLAEVVRRIVGLSEEDTRSEILARLGAFCHGLGFDEYACAAIAPKIAVVLGIEPRSAAFPQATDSEIAAQLIDAMLQLLAGSSRGRPFICVIEDVQWASPETLTVLRAWAASDPATPGMLILTARPEVAVELASWPRTEVLTLAPLSTTDAVELMKATVGGADLNDAALLALAEHCAGNPLFCEEYASSLQEQAWLGAETSSIRDGSVSEVPLPHTVGSVIAARIDALPEAARDWVRAAAVIGERFGTAELSSLRGAPLPPDVVDDLLQREFVHYDGHADMLRFHHVLVRETAYHSLTKGARAALHERYARLLLDRAKDGTQLAGIIDHHVERAFSLSCEIMLRGPDLQRRALQQFERSLHAAERAARDRESQLLSERLSVVTAAADKLSDPLPPRDRTRLAFIQADMLSLRSDYGGARRDMRQVAALAERLDIVDIAAAAHLSLAWLEREAGTSADLKHHCERVLHYARMAGDARRELDARWLLAIQDANCGDAFAAPLTEGLALRERALSLGEETWVALALAKLVFIAIAAGQLATAARLADECVALSERLGLRLNQAVGLFRVGEVSFYRGQTEEGLRTVAESIAAIERCGRVFETLTPRRFLARALLLTRRPEEALVILDSALRISDELGATFELSGLFALHAEVAIRLGDATLARESLRSSMATVDADDRDGQAYVHEITGKLHLQTGDVEAALRDLGIAAQLRDTGELHLYRVEPMIDLAQAEQRAGQVALAAEHYQMAAEWLTAAGFTHRRDDLTATSAMLRAL